MSLCVRQKQTKPSESKLTISEYLLLKAGIDCQKNVFVNIFTATVANQWDIWLVVHEQNKISEETGGTTWFKGVRNLTRTNSSSQEL